MKELQDHQYLRGLIIKQQTQGTRGHSQVEDSTVHLELSMKPDLLAKDGTNQVYVGVMFLVVCRQVLH